MPRDDHPVDADPPADNGEAIESGEPDEVEYDEETGILLSGEENAAVRIKLERDKRGWSTTSLSERMNDAGYEMNPSAVWRIENRKRRLNLDEAIGFAEVFGVDLRNFAGPPQLAAQARAMELIDNVVVAYQQSQQAQVHFGRARDEFDAYISAHPEIGEDAEVMITNALQESVARINRQLQERFSPSDEPTG